MRRAWLVAGLLILSGWSAGLRAQKPETVQAPLTTLHLYANLAQVPVLVLDRHLGAMPAIPFDLFRLSLDRGTLFTPTRVRREAGDPISYSILLDVSGDENELLKQMPKAVEIWARGSLQPKDEVSVYAVDCSLVMTATRVSGFDGARLALAVQQAVASKAVHGPRGKPAERPACWSKKPLWDSLDLIAAQMAGRPGRRVVLVLTDGFDGGSKYTWRDVRERAIAMATAIFALSEQRLSREPGSAVEDRLWLLCQLTGGVVLPAYTVAADLRDFSQMLHDRYILEFPRPQGLEARQYELQVTIRKRNAVALTTGVSMTVETEEEKAPENQPTDRAAGPEAGPRRVIKPK